MLRRENGACAYYTSQLLNTVDDGTLLHGFSTRHGGVSRDPYIGSLNFGFSVGEERTLTLENYRRFSSAIGTSFEHLVCCRQAHTSNVVTVTREHLGLGLEAGKDRILPPVIREQGWDALVTRERGVTLLIRTADCVPILFYDPVHYVIGAAHAGWRGTYDGIAAKTLSAMIALGASAETTYACIGHAVGVCCYEVDAAFCDRFWLRFGGMFCSSIFRFTSKGRIYCDLRAANRLLLQGAGMKEENIELSTLCTCCDPKEFHSHRYAMKHNDGKRGLMAAAIGMQNELPFWSTL